jgi:hypothetical protein
MSTASLAPRRSESARVRYEYGAGAASVEEALNRRAAKRTKRTKKTKRAKS